MSDKPAILRQVTITAANKWIDYNWDGGGYETEVAVGIYDDINALLTALVAAMNVTISSPGEITYSVAVVSDVLVVNINGGGSDFELLWKTGTHGSDGTGTHIGDALGFSDAADDTGAHNYDADIQPPSVWVAHRAIAQDSDDHWMPEHVGSDGRAVLDSTDYKRLSVGERYTRTIKFPVMLPAVTWADEATGSDENRDFESFWLETHSGEPIRWCEDRDDLATYVDCWMTEPKQWRGKVQRNRGGVSRYNLALELLRNES